MQTFMEHEPVKEMLERQCRKIKTPTLFKNSHFIDKDQFQGAKQLYLQLDKITHAGAGEIAKQL